MCHKRSTIVREVPRNYRKYKNGRTRSCSTKSISEKGINEPTDALNLRTISQDITFAHIHRVWNPARQSTSIPTHRLHGYEADAARIRSRIHTPNSKKYNYVYHIPHRHRAALCSRFEVYNLQESGNYARESTCRCAPLHATLLMYE